LVVRTISKRRKTVLVRHSSNGWKVSIMLKYIVSACHTYFLECGVDGNVHDKYDTILLHSALYQGSPEMVARLLNHCVKVNAKNHWGETALHVISRSRHNSQGGVHAALVLLERGADVNSQRKDNWTPLHVASYIGNIEIAGLLLEHGADLEAEWGDMGDKPLHQLSYGKYRSPEDGVSIAQLLLDRGADVNTRRKDHHTPLHYASFIGNIEIAGLLLDHGADLEAACRDTGEKPLHVVSYGQYRSLEDGVKVAQLLLDRGADVNTRRKDHQTPLHVASFFGNIEIAGLLLEHGADLEAEWGDIGEKPLHQLSYGQYRSLEDGVKVAQLLLDHGADVNTRRKDHHTPLHYASHFGNIEIARLLLEHGADLEAACGDIGEKPLHRVSYGQYRSLEDGVKVAKLLLGRGADVNTRRKDHWTPLHVASHFGNIEIAGLLLDHGADLEAACGDIGEKPLHRVSSGQYRSPEDGVSVAQLLLDRGADVNSQRKDNWTPLHVASYIGNIEIAGLLLEYGADLEAAWGDMGDKPLHQLSYGKYRSPEDGVKVAQLLFDRGADVNTRRNDRRTPLHVASYSGNSEIVQLLIDHGAEVDAVDDFGKAPLHDVSLGKYESQDDGVRVARLLLDHGADVNAKARSGHTPLDLASINERPNLKLAELFLEHARNVNEPR
jgi:ankyrin repeat protein